MNKKAILLVSFGTSHLDTKEKTLDYIEEQVKEAFPEYSVYSAFASNFLIQKIKSRYGRKVYRIEEALQVMKEEGTTEVILQSIQILSGMKKIEGWFPSISVGMPILSDKRDYDEVVCGLKNALPVLLQGEAFLFMCHGTKGEKKIDEKEMYRSLFDHGCKDWYLVAMQGEPYIEEALNRMKGENYKRIYLTPFLIVAGKHAKRDMVGPDLTSIESKLLLCGYEVVPIIRGLGEYKFLSDIIIRHIKDAQ